MTKPGSVQLELDIIMTRIPPILLSIINKPSQRIDNMCRLQGLYLLHLISNFMTITLGMRECA